MQDNSHKHDDRAGSVLQESHPCSSQLSADSDKNLSENRLCDVLALVLVPCCPGPGNSDDAREARKKELRRTRRAHADKRLRVVVHNSLRFPHNKKVLPGAVQIDVQ